MKYLTLSILALAALAGPAFAPGKEKINVVTTLPDYADLARRIGGDRVEVAHIVLGNQDAHFIRPKPSFVDLIKAADVLIATGLDLELWLPTVVDKSGNPRVRSGQEGYIAAARGCRMLEIPEAKTRSEGGVHVYGNPHLTCSPVNLRVAARNICSGLVKNDREGEEIYTANLKTFLTQLDEKLFGEELVKLLGGDTLASMAEKGTLVSFLEEKSFRGKPLIESLGGWMKRMMPMRGGALVTYHKNWVYFLKLFGLEEAGTVEPKPGIPPTPRHVVELIEMMKERKIPIILSANYFDREQVRSVADRVGATAVIVPLYVGGEENTDDCFALVDHWIDRLLKAFESRSQQ